MQWLNRVAARVEASILWDALGLVGLVGLVIGFALIWPPLAWIVGGAGILAIAFLGARSAA